MDPLSSPLSGPSPAPAVALDVLIVGPGRLGRSVAMALRAAGHRVRLVGRDEPIPPAPVVWLTVPDREIAAAAARVPPGGVVLHASGASDLEPLRPHQPAGSLHPLMSFPGPEVAMPRMDEVPAAIAGDPEARAVATGIALALGWRPFEVPGDRRLYHAAAVMAGNFATALLAEAAAVLVAAGVPAVHAPGLLAPLALTSLRNAAAIGPARALTGPVARGDDGVIAAHRLALASLEPRLLCTYDALLDAARALVAPPPEPESSGPVGDDRPITEGSALDTPVLRE